MNPAFPGLHWLHHASFRLDTGGKVLYLDPYKIRDPVPADLILCTHEHGDHYSPKDIRLVAKPGATVVCPVRAAEKAEREGFKVVRAVPGQTLEVEGLRIRAVPAYNRFKPMHARRFGHTGFVLDLPEGSLYHAGDTDLIPEMSDLGPIRLALLPVGRVLFLRPTMGPREAAEAVRRIAPTFAAPMHYGFMPGGRGDGRAFQALAGDRALLLEEEDPRR